MKENERESINQEKEVLNDKVNKDEMSQKAKEIANEIISYERDINEPTLSDKVDKVVAHKWIGIVIFALVMLGIFYTSQVLIGPFFGDLIATLFEKISEIIETGLDKIGTNEVIKGLILEGIIGGVSAVLGFLPLIMILFFLLALLEDSGYMARVSLILDRFFKKIGLSGKSVIPMVVGSACAVPAISSARIIKNKRQKRMTILLTPFIPCGAKLPVIALFLGVFFSGKAYMTLIVYFIVLIAIFLTGVLLKILTNAKFDDEDTFLIVELPEYKIPDFKRAFFTMLRRARGFLIKAGTVILIANAIIWLLSNFNFSMQLVDSTEDSILRYLAEPIAWILIPLGFGVWGLAAAAITGFVAKEEVVGALAVIFLFSVQDFNVVNVNETHTILSSVAGLTAVSALAYMLFNLFTPPCFAAIGAMREELKSKKWLAFAIGIQLFIGFFFAMIVYQVGTIIDYGELGRGFIASIIIFVTFIIAITYLAYLAKQGKGLAKIE